MKKNFVSEIDQLLSEFNQNQAPSDAQQALAKKLKKVYASRDQAQAFEEPTQVQSVFWEDF